MGHAVPLVRPPHQRQVRRTIGEVGANRRPEGPVRYRIRIRYRINIIGSAEDREAHQFGKGCIQVRLPVDLRARERRFSAFNLSRSGAFEEVASRTLLH